MLHFLSENTSILRFPEHLSFSLWSNWNKLPIFYFLLSIRCWNYTFLFPYDKIMEEINYTHMQTSPNTVMKYQYTFAIWKCNCFFASYLYWSFWTLEAVFFLFCNSLRILLIFFLHICFILTILQFISVCWGWKIFWYCLLLQNRMLKQRIINIKASGWSIEREQHYYNSHPV